MELKQTFRMEVSTLDQTARLASLLARSIEGGQFLALSGELGAGKTTLTRLLTQQLSCQKLATSPTFALFQEYGGGRLPVFHADLYRLASEDELYDLGWEETLERFSNGLMVVEWADKFIPALPPDRLNLDCQYGEEDEERVLDFSAQGPRSCRLLERLQESWQ